MIKSVLYLRSRVRGYAAFYAGRGNMAIEIEVAEESGNLFVAHRLRMTFVVEEDEAADPVDVGLLCPDAVAFDAQVLPDAVQELGCRSAS